MPAPLFPGSVAVSDLAVYDWEAEDGRCGGSPHLHTASTEGYVVVEGTGAVQTLSGIGYEEHRLAVGDVLWFSPGTVHRLINDGDLRVIVVMQNSGLPEAGDAVLTFPARLLSDPDAYAAAASLPDGPDREAAARRRRDLATEGYLELRGAVELTGRRALEEFQARAVRLVQSKVPAWTALWERTVAAETDRTRTQLADLAAGRVGLLPAAAVVRGERAEQTRTFGMCGRLRTWEWPSSV